MVVIITATNLNPNKRDQTDSFLEGAILVFNIIVGQLKQTSEAISDLHLGDAESASDLVGISDQFILLLTNLDTEIQQASDNSVLAQAIASSPLQALAIVNQIIIAQISTVSDDLNANPNQPLGIIMKESKTVFNAVEELIKVYEKILKAMIKIGKPLNALIEVQSALPSLDIETILSGNRTCTCA
jgi:hypothetical protein